MTDQGPVAIEKINTKINTIRHKKIEGIVKTKLKTNYLVCFEKNSLGPNVPCNRTLMSGNHMVYANGAMRKAKELLQMVNFNRIYKVNYDGESMYNVLMEKHETMLVNNMVCETLDPTNNIAKLHHHLKTVKQEEHKLIIDGFNLNCVVEQTQTNHSALGLVGSGYVQRGRLNQGVKRNMVYNVYR